MIVAVVDIGSNSARLLVASVDDDDVVTQLRRERRYLRLGDDVHSLGLIGPRKLKEAARVAKRSARIARKSGAEHAETIVTAPGRQAANGDDLVGVLAEATQAPVIVLSGEEEGRLAWEGAVARMEDPSEVVAVVDLGGGSCELAVGTPVGPSWVRSVDAGALQVTRAYLGGNPPDPMHLATARREISRLVAVFEPPRPDAALAVGGTARAIARIVGRRLDVERLEHLVGELARVPAEALAEPHGITPERAHTLLGGTLVLAATARRLETDLEVGRGGLREGAALALARAATAAA